MKSFQVIYFLAFLYCPFVSAIILNPTVLSLNVDKDGFSQVVITNNSTSRLPLEVSIHKLSFEEDGSYQSMAETTTALMVFPPAAIVQSGQNQVFRLQWNKDIALPTSQSFFVRFTHIPLAPQMAVKHGTLGAGVNIQINYNALLHVYSETQQAHVVLKVDGDGKAKLINSGDRFAYTNRLSFDDIDPDLQSRFMAMVGEQFIAPYTTLDFDAGSPLPAGDYHGREKGL